MISPAAGDVRTNTVRTVCVEKARQQFLERREAVAKGLQERLDRLPYRFRVQLEPAVGGDREHGFAFEPVVDA